MNPNITPKLLQFNKELQVLLDKYLYTLKAVIRSDEEKIYAEIQVRDVPPKVALTPTQPADPASPQVDNPTNPQVDKPADPALQPTA